MEFGEIHKFIVILIITFGFCLTFWVYWADRKKEVNRIFFLMNIFILSWIGLSYVSDLPGQIGQALLWNRLNFGVISLFITTAYFFSLNFPHRTEKYSIWDKSILVVGIFFALISVSTNLIIKDIASREWGTDIIYGSWGSIFLGIVFILTILILFKLFKKYHTLSFKEKLKVQYFLLGVFVFAILNIIFNIALPSIKGILEYYYLGNYSAIFLLGFTAYAIVKKELFDINVVLTAFLVGIIAILLFLDALLFTEIFWVQIAKGVILLIFLFFGYYLIKSVIREIEQRKKLQKMASDLEKANAELRKLDASKSEFISIASHQLRTPLAVIKGYLSMIDEGTYGNLPKEAKEKLKSVFESNERLIRLVNSLLNISRIEAGKLVPEKKKVRIEDLISRTIKEFSIIATEKNLYLKFIKPDRKLPEISVDEGKIGQALLNIIDNAIKYTGKGGVTVKAEKDEKDENILIEVSDTGEGLAKEDTFKMFQSFSRGNIGNWLHSEGAGLGLYISRKFVEMHGGQIWAKSEGRGKGSRFYIKLPIKS